MPDIFLYKSDSNVYTIIVSDPTILRPGSGNVTVDLFGSFLEAILGNLDIQLTNPVPSQPSVGQTLISFGVSPTNPSEITGFSPTTQIFASPGIPGNAYRPNNWSMLGQIAMGGSLLVAPGNGCLSGRVFYVIASGNLMLPMSATDVTFKVTLFQNYFSTQGDVIRTQSDPMSVTIPYPISTGTTGWRIICKLTGAGRNGLLIGNTIINGAPAGKLYSNKNPRVEPKIQLSVGVELQGSANSGLPRATMTQFEIRSI